MRKKIPNDSARYHLFRFKHTHEGDYTECILFIYSMPGYSCSIKERMLYSSCKAPLLDSIQQLNVHIEKKVRNNILYKKIYLSPLNFFVLLQLEIDSGDELTQDYLLDEVYPKVNLHRPKFDKPKGPPNRGARRITKPQK